MISASSRAVLYPLKRSEPVHVDDASPRKADLPVPGRDELASGFPAPPEVVEQHAVGLEPHRGVRREHDRGSCQQRRMQVPVVTRGGHHDDAIETPGR